MKELSIRGLRSLKDTGAIRIAPITVLLGENSSGKSTFLRTFPLLRQSIEVRTSEPLLWFGRLVDFGSFNESVSSFNTDKAVELELSTNMEASFGTSRYPAAYPEEDGEACQVLIRVIGGPPETNSPREAKIASFVQVLRLDVCEMKIEISFDRPDELAKVLIDGEDFTATAQATYKPMKTASPTPTFYRKSDEIVEEDEEEDERSNPQITFEQQLHAFVKGWVHNRTKDATIDELTARIRLGRASSILQSVKTSQEQSGLWRKQVLGWTEESPDFIHFKRLLWGARLENTLDSLSEAVRRDFSAISYITPLRAAAERYYRQQGLAINELDSKGENFALFLRSLSAADRDSLKKWLGNALDVYVELVDSRGHVSLNLVDHRTGAWVNLADTGFGYSQLLPIAVQLWLTQSGRRSRLHPRLRRHAIVAIEQPELHLHPRIQAKVADILARVASTKGGQQRASLVVETHSEALVNRLGKLVAEGTLLPSDVNVVLFNKRSFAEPTTVVTTGFDSNGFLKDWPLGFFNAT